MKRVLFLVSAALLFLVFGCSQAGTSSGTSTVVGDIIPAEWQGTYTCAVSGTPSNTGEMKVSADTIAFSGFLTVASTGYVPAAYDKDYKVKTFYPNGSVVLVEKNVGGGFITTAGAEPYSFVIPGVSVNDCKTK